jgi:membrane associated rhomboid family serine protease
VLDLSLGYSLTSPLYTHLTYSFQHASILHLVFNSLAFIGFYRVLKGYIKYLFPIIVFIAFVASFYSEYALPTVGASGMVYAMIGMYIGLIITKKITIVSKKDAWVGLISLILMYSISIFKESSNSVLHGICLFLGLLFIMFNSILRYAEVHTRDNKHYQGT